MRIQNRNGYHVLGWKGRYNVCGGVMKFYRNLLLWFVAATFMVVLFQNCGQQGDVALKLQQDDNIEATDICAVNPTHPICTGQPPTGKVEEYRYIDVKQPTIPNLKIFLVLDNSDSMRVSQVNLVNNIEKMFTANGEGLRDYNSEIFIITTAQLNYINKSLNRSSVDAKTSYQTAIENIYQIQNVQSVISMLDVLRPTVSNTPKTTGLLEGDMVGFKLKVNRTLSSIGNQYDELENIFYPAYVTYPTQPSVFSVKYYKGGSIDDLVQQIKQRVEYLNPENQILSKTISFDKKQIDNVPLSEVVEKESGLCAMSRILYEVKNDPSTSLISKGELATFILVSDEKEHDLNGEECVKSYKFKQPVPGDLYRGQCVDLEATVAYEMPSTKTVNYNVRKPYYKHVYNLYEYIDNKIDKVDGSCVLKGTRSVARLKVYKNTHTLSFDRKIVNNDGTQAVDYYGHKIKFDRISLRHDITFTRTNLKHSLKFDRKTIQHTASATRVKVSPKYKLDIQRNKISKYQKVTYTRQIILTKEGGQQVIVSTDPAVTINIPGVNYSSASQCTTTWLRSQKDVSSKEVTLNGSESYKYTISECSINNTTVADNYSNVIVYGSLPSTTNCNSSLAATIKPHPTLQSYESIEYVSVLCTQQNSDETSYNFSKTVSGTAPASCTATYISDLDASKPNIDSGKNETLEYRSPSCIASNLNDLAVVLGPYAGKYSAADLLTYIKTKDGNKTNVEYSNYSSVGADETLANQKIDNQPGAYTGGTSSSDLQSYVRGLQNTLASEVSYSDVVVTKDNLTDSGQETAELSGRCASDSSSELKTQDGNKVNTDYANILCTEIPHYKFYDNVTQTILGKAPSVCDSAYAQSKDNAVPTLLTGEKIIYEDVKCTNDTASTLSITRNDTTVKYDGSYGNKFLKYEKSLGTSESKGRNCTADEQSAIISQEQSVSTNPLPTIDGSTYYLDSTKPCRVYNSEYSNSDSQVKKIQGLVNSDNLVKTGTQASVCDDAVSTYCSSGTTNNSDGTLNCESVAASFVAYVAAKPEYRSYSLKAPVFDSTKNEISWFGFDKTKVDLLLKKCSEVSSACGTNITGLENTTVETYFKNTYAGGSDSKYALITKTARSTQTLSDGEALAECATLLPSGYDKCNNLNEASTSIISYQSTASTVSTSKGFDETVSCDDSCTADLCKSASGSSIAYSGKTLNQYYGTYCTVGDSTPSGTRTANTVAVTLTKSNANSTAYANGTDVCNLDCSTSGLCKIRANANVDLTSGKTVKKYLAEMNQNISLDKIVSCKIKRNSVPEILGKKTLADLENECTKPGGNLNANRYLFSSQKYYDANPLPINSIVLLKGGESNIEEYVKRGLSENIGSGFASMISFSSKNLGTDGDVEGIAYERVSQSISGQTRDVKSSDQEYGESLKFLGEKVASQLSSSFIVKDVAPSQQITRIWYSSWFTQGKYIELSPADFSVSGTTFIVLNKTLVEKMKNESAFKFFVEIY